jgi:phosphotriesterase-related protein
MGITYAHEHLLVTPQLPDEKYEAYTLDDEAKSTAETAEFASYGGKTIVEMTPINYGRDVLGLQRIAKATGTNIICTSGYHKELFQPSWFAEKSDDELFQIVYGEVLQGIDGTGVRPGVIKFGTSHWQITAQEERAIRAVARVHLETGIPISTHCDKGTMGMEQLDRLEKMGVEPQHVLLCHIDSAEYYDYALELCSRGAHICFDHVGRELANHDHLRIEMLKKLIIAGYIKQLHISGDMGKKEYLPAYGGKPGLRYILTTLKEDLLKEITEEDYNQIMITNAAAFFLG